jgi:hypothetical protein
VLLSGALRVLLTIVLAIAFVVGFFAFFLLDSVLRYSTDADAFVDTARSAEVRTMLADATEEFLFQEIAADPSLSGISRTELRAMIDSVISEQWFEATVRSAHGAAMTAIDDASKAAVIDLRQTKAALHGALDELVQRANTQCAAVLGVAACADAEAARAVVGAFRVRAGRGIDRIRDEVDLVAELRGGDARKTANLDAVRSRIGDVRTWRWIGLGLLAVCLGLIAVVNLHPLSRLLTATGVSLMLAAGIYLALVGVVRASARTRIGDEIADARSRHATEEPFDRIIADGTRKLTVELVDRSTRQSTIPVTLVGLVGIGLFAGGIVTRRGS